MLLISVRDFLIKKVFTLFSITRFLGAVVGLIPLTCMSILCSSGFRETLKKKYPKAMETIATENRDCSLPKL